MKFERIFVTVGTTEFNNLIRKLSEQDVYRILKDHLQCKKLTIQVGRGEKIDFDYPGIRVQIFEIKESIADDIEGADLVISHAGAGTCIDVLSRRKPLIVVINDTLMNNHQTELAEQLASDKYLFYSTLSQLPEVLKSFDVLELKEYEKGNVDKFIEYLDNYMGFIE